MGYQSGRYGRDDRDYARSDPYGSQDRYSRAGYGRDRYGASYGRDEYSARRRGYGPEGRTPPPDYDYDDRGFFDRSGDEVRSWFGDEEAERRREYDEYLNRRYGDPRDRNARTGFVGSAAGFGFGYAPFYDQNSGQAPSQDRTAGYERAHDPDYHSWRNERMAELDRDYAEYRNENRDRFHSEFNNWRTRRTTQRGLVGQVAEHAEVVGSDGSHVGTVDKVAGDRIILTRTDRDAKGHHHSIPSRWIDRVEDGKVILEKNAEQAQDAWRDEDRRQALFGENQSRSEQPHYLDRAFKNTY